jgi:hypothetical protein
MGHEDVVALLGDGGSKRSGSSRVCGGSSGCGGSKGMWWFSRLNVHG